MDANTLYRIPPLKFTEDDDGTLYADTAHGTYHITHTSGGTWEWWLARHAFAKTYHESCQSRSIAACNQHNLEVLSKWLEPVDLAGQLRALAENNRVLASMFGSAKMKSAETFDILARCYDGIADRIERGEAICEETQP